MENKVNQRALYLAELLLVELQHSNETPATKALMVTIDRFLVEVTEQNHITTSRKVV